MLSAGTGCESLQRKFTRPPKHAAARPAPIINFLDYGEHLTPLDRYRKHYLMFDYWNQDLIEALKRPPLNEKRVRRASVESLSELQALKGLLDEELALRLQAVIEERSDLDHQLQRSVIQDVQAHSILRLLEPQSRQIHRDFFWRQVEQHLKSPEAARQP